MCGKKGKRKWEEETGKKKKLNDSVIETYRFTRGQFDLARLDGFHSNKFNSKALKNLPELFWKTFRSDWTDSFK
jgi:hypothetical protein